MGETSVKAHLFVSQAPPPTACLPVGRAGRRRPHGSVYNLPLYTFFLHVICWSGILTKKLITLSQGGEKNMSIKTKARLKVAATAKPVLARPIVQKVQVRKQKPSVKSRAIKGSSKPKPEVILINEMIEDSRTPLNLPDEISKEYIVVHRCGNCSHLPMSTDKLITIFSVLVALLTVSVLIQVGQLDVNRILDLVRF